VKARENEREREREGGKKREYRVNYVRVLFLMETKPKYLVRIYVCSFAANDIK